MDQKSLYFFLAIIIGLLILLLTLIDDKEKWTGKGGDKSKNIKKAAVTGIDNWKGVDPMR